MKFTINDVLLAVPAMIIMAVLFIVVLIKYRTSTLKVMSELCD
jgi:hypothetical protein